jgi:N-acetylneuraminic acid mutarotase
LVTKSSFGGGGRVYAVGFSIENKGYIGLGVGGSNSKNNFWEYDVQNNTWTQKTNFSAQGKVSSVGFSIADKRYAGTGSLTTTIGNKANESRNIILQTMSMLILLRSQPEFIF